MTLVALEISEVLGSFQGIHRLEIFVQWDTLNVLFGKKISEQKNQKSFFVEISRVSLLYLQMWNFFKVTTMGISGLLYISL